MLFRSVTPYTKINSKWIKGLNVRLDSIKLLEENIGRTLFDINHSNILGEPSPRVMEIKAKINKWDLMKLESFCTAKETINKMKGQPAEWEKMMQLTRNLFPKYTSSSYNSITKQNKQKQPNQKMGRRSK